MSCVSDTEKKRGRKKKEVEEVEEVVAVEKKKRGRKKKWESFNNVKIHMPESDTEEDIIGKNMDKADKENYEKESVAFGNLNITVHTNKDISNTENIKYSIINNIISDKSNFSCRIELSDSEESDLELDNVYTHTKSKSLIHYDNIYSTGKELSRTDILCFNCCHSFYNKKFVLPIDYDPKLKRYKVFGNFCSPNCAKRYAMEDKKLCDKIYILNHMCKEMFDTRFIIKAAPSKLLLKSFGGTLSIEEYRNNFIEEIKYKVKPINSKTICLNVNEV